MISAPPLEVRLARRGYVPGIGVGLIALAALIAAADGNPIGLFPAAILGLFAVLLALLAALSRIFVDSDVLDVRFFGLRATRIPWEAIERVSFGMAFPSVSYAMSIRSKDGRELKVHLNWWRRESELLSVVFDQIQLRHVAIDGDVAAMMRRWHRNPTGPQLVHLALAELVRENPRRFRLFLVLAAILFALVALTVRNSDDVVGGVLFGGIFGVISAPLWIRQPVHGWGDLLQPVIGLLAPLAAFAAIAPSLGASYAAAYVVYAFFKELFQGSSREAAAGPDSNEGSAPRFYGEPDIWPSLPTGPALTEVSTTPPGPPEESQREAEARPKH